MALSNDRYYLTDGSHVLVAGSTGSGSRFGGKTTTMNWWQDQLYQNGWADLVVFFTTKNNENIANAQKVTTLKGLAESYRAGYRQIHYETRAGRMDTDACVAEHEAVIQTVRQLPGEKAIFHDEAQVYRESEGLNWCLTEGGNLKEGNSVRSICGSQRAWNLTEEQRNCLTVKCWVGPLTSEGQSYFENEGMKRVVDRVKGEVDPYEWIVTDGGELLHVNPPVPDKYT